MRITFSISLLMLFFIQNVHSQDSLSSVYVSSEPAGAQIYIDSVLSGSSPHTIPIITTGRHILKLQREGYENWITVLNIESIDTNKVHAILNPLRGQIQVNCDVKIASIYIDGKPRGHTPKLIKEIEYGEHYIEVIQKRYYPGGYEFNVFRDTIEIFDSNIKIINATLKSSWLSINVRPESSFIIIDEKKFDTATIVKEKMLYGKHKIQLYNDGFKSKTFEIFLKSNEHKILEYNLISLTYKSIFYRSFVFPGLGHFYADKKFRGYLYGLLELGTIGLAVYADIQMSDASESYKKKYELYINSTDETESLNLHKTVQNKYDEFQDYKQFRNIMIGSAIAIWLINIYDAHLLGKKFEKNNSTLSHLMKNTDLVINTVRKNYSIGLTIKL